MANPSTLEELFRSLGLALTVRPADDEADACACTLAAPDGRTFEIESVMLFDVDPDTGEEWVVEPTPSRVLGVIADIKGPCCLTAEGCAERGRLAGQLAAGDRGAFL